MSKQLTNLIQKAFQSGYSNVNGRQRFYGCVGELESKYTFEYNQETERLCLYHWGTQILSIGAVNSTLPTVFSSYVSSKSDRDAIDFVFDYLDLKRKGYSVSYRPSLGKGFVTANFGTGEIITKEQ